MLPADPFRRPPAPVAAPRRAVPGAAARWWPAAAAALLFLLLTQLPLPADHAPRCPDPAGRVNLVPFESFRVIGVYWTYREGLFDFATKGLLVSIAGNLVLPALFAGLLRARGQGRGAAVLAGTALSLAAELTQLTALWGLYDCAWRRFDVDDLILNTAGAALGASLVRRRGAAA